MADMELKQPPFSDSAEQSVLGGLLLDNDAFDKIADRVADVDFFISANAIIFRAIYKILASRKPADIVTVAEYLDGFGHLEQVGGVAFLGGLVQNTPTAANIERYADVVREHALMRKMIHVSDNITESLYNRNGADAKELLDRAQGAWMAIGENMARSADTMQQASPVMDRVLDKLDALAKNPHGSDVTGLETGLKDLDKMTTGLQPGELVVLAARPSMGKTSLALNIMEHVALHLRKNAAFFSLEMINDQLGVRLLSSVARVNQQRVKVGRMNDAEWQTTLNAAEKLRGAGIYLDDESNIGVNEIRARARRLHRECMGGLQLIIIDYLQLMQWPDEARDEVNAFATITRQLKGLAKELHLPVIALSQLNRSLESRPQKRPVMSDLRGSGGIEQDADLILFIYRDQVYNPDSMDKGIAEIIIGKQRNGPIGTVHTAFIDHLMRFENLEMGAVVPSIEHYRAKKSGGNFRAKNYGDEDEYIAM